jgi:hypothetical protein
MGKSSILMVLALSFTLVILSPNMYEAASVATVNYLTYYTKTAAHNAALSGANIASNELFLNPSATASYNKVKFGDATFSTSLTDIKGTNRKRILSYGYYKSALDTTTYSDTVEVILQPSSFAKFCVYLKQMTGVYWATGDTVRGPCHIDNQFNVSGNPVFFGKTTASGKLYKNPSTSKPQFLGGFQTGISVPMPLNLDQAKTAASSGGKLFTPPAAPAGNYIVDITFNADGTLRYIETKGATKLKDTTVTLTSLAPNGVILVNNGNLLLKGTIKGRATVGALGTSTTAGNCIIMGDILCSDDPQTNPNSKDMLGVIVDRDIQMPLPSGFPTVACKHDYLIEAALFTRTGKFYATQDSRMGRLGNVTIHGSIASYSIGAFATADSKGNILYGYSNIFNFDTRFMSSSPPYYPNTSLFEVLSWRE